MIPVTVILALVGYGLGLWVEPKLNLVTKTFASQVYKQKTYPITITNSKIKVNDKEFIGDNYKYNIPLQAGKNTIKLAASNGLGRQSNITPIEINNLQNDWNKTTCNGLDFVLNTDSLQYGYSGINNDELPQFKAKYQDIVRNDNGYTKMLKFDCDNTPSQLQNHAKIYTKNTKANCWNCDSNVSYITIISSPNNNNTPAPSLVTEKNDLRQETIYKSLSGIDYKLIQIRSPDLTQFKFIANFEKNNRNYTITGFDYIKEKHAEFSTNFYSVLDNIYPVDYNNNQTYKLTDQLNTASIKSPNLKGFSIDYKTNWQVLSYSQTAFQDQQTVIKPSDVIEFKKDDYSIRFTIYPSSDPITSSVVDNINNPNYIKQTIDNKEIEIPKLITINYLQLGTNNSIRVIENPIVVTNEPKNTYSQIVKTPNKKIMIDLEYMGLNYEYIDGVTKRVPSPIDDIKDKEILELFKTIKWGD